jgi:hypothetical protein
LTRPGFTFEDKIGANEKGSKVTKGSARSIGKALKRKRQLFEMTSRQQQQSCRQPEKQRRKITPGKGVVPGANRKQPGSVSHSPVSVISQ